MGGWAKADFGSSNLPQTALMFAGGNALDLEDKIVGVFDQVIQKRHGVYHTYIVKKGQKEYALLFQVYGPALTVDGLHILHDGGCKEVLFIGYAWCCAKAAVVGDYIIPSKTLLLDGFTNILAPRAKWARADADVQSTLERAAQNVGKAIHKGVTVSVPSVFRKPKGYGKTLRKVRGIAHEQELGSLLYFSKALKIKSAGVLIVSDTFHQTLYGEEAVAIRLPFSAGISSPRCRDGMKPNGSSDCSDCGRA